jgi:hypothetical protein
MANFSEPISNPIDDATTEELREICAALELVEDGEIDELEHWELVLILEEEAQARQADW